MGWNSSSLPTADDDDFSMPLTMTPSLQPTAAPTWPPSYAPSYTPGTDGADADALLKLDPEAWAVPSNSSIAKQTGALVQSMFAKFLPIFAKIDAEGNDRMDRRQKILEAGRISGKMARFNTILTEAQKIMELSAFSGTIRFSEPTLAPIHSPTLPPTYSPTDMSAGLEAKIADETLQIREDKKTGRDSSMDVRLVAFLEREIKNAQAHAAAAKYAEYTQTPTPQQVVPTPAPTMNKATTNMVAAIRTVQGKLEAKAVAHAADISARTGTTVQAVIDCLLKMGGTISTRAVPCTGTLSNPNPKKPTAAKKAPKLPVWGIKQTAFQAWLQHKGSKPAGGENESRDRD
jgi:hypothetical protein